MTATPTTTKLGPDRAHLRDLMRSLAEQTSTEAPILSVYVDVRPEAHGERPGERSELITVRDRLNAIIATLDPHTDARESVDADAARIQAYLETQELAGTSGLAMFACQRIGLWETVAAQAEFDTQVSAGPTADLFQLARLLDDSVAAVVAIVDTNTCRLFVTRRGGLVERPGPDEPVDEHRRPDVGGWSQARFQRHVDMQDKRFAAEAAAAIERLVRREKATHVILAGHERAIGILLPELSEPVRPLVEHVARIQMRSSADDVRDEVVPMLAALEEAEGTDVADRAVAGARAGDLGVTGVDATMAALEAGQVDELVIDETAAIDEDLRGELIRQAALTDARVEIVREDPELLRFEGIGATLRYRA
ncbi:MAG: Vms1/Ankzf1 family peptidyl-tRNA hydrolase [Candidatus Limnocylindria bacterium]